MYHFLPTGADTGGKYALWEALVSPGGGPPPHVHSREEEWFYVTDGAVTFTVDGARSVAGPGAFVRLPPGVPHAFKNESDRPARMLISVAPAGLEEMFLEVVVPLPDGAATAPPAAPDEIARLLAAAPRDGIEIRVPGYDTGPGTASG